MRTLNIEEGVPPADGYQDPAAPRSCRGWSPLRWPTGWRFLLLRNPWSYRTIPITN